MTTRKKNIDKTSKNEAKKGFIYGIKSKNANKITDKVLKQRLKYISTVNIQLEDINSDLVYCTS